MTRKKKECFHLYDRGECMHCGLVDPEVFDMYTFARSRDGKTVHLGTCRHAMSGLPWIWAERNPSKVRGVVDEFGYRCCTNCHPERRMAPFRVAPETDNPATTA